MAPPKLLAISPTPECICLAARIRQHWQTLAIGGAKLVTKCLQEWSSAHPHAQAIIMVAEVVSPAAVRAALEELTGKGGNVIWFAREDSASVIKACTGVERVKLCIGASLEEAVEQIYITQGGDQKWDAEDLQDYLRYKINLFFMGAMTDTAPVLEAIETLAKWKKGEFNLETMAKADCASVRHFQRTDFPYIEGQSAPVLNLKRRLLELAPTPLSVLITGETGTGKEAAAFYLHEFSTRRAQPFVSINCAGLDEHYLRSEMFGHEKGAFTGAIEKRQGLVEQASGGTLFLDELGDMPLSVQADLLRFLQTRRFRPLGSDEEHAADVRLIAAAQPDLHEKMERGEFRIDLFYRIAEVELGTPRLADVPEDIRRIVRNIAYRYVDQQGLKEEIGDALEYFRKGEPILRSYGWPGNVRELARYVRRRLFLKDDVLAEISRRAAQPALVKGQYPKFKPIQSLADIEPAREVTQRYIRHVWAQRGSLSQQELCDRLELSVNTFKSHLK